MDQKQRKELEERVSDLEARFSNREMVAIHTLAKAALWLADTAKGLKFVVEFGTNVAKFTIAVIGIYLAFQVVYMFATDASAFFRWVGVEQ